MSRTIKMNLFNPSKKLIEERKESQNKQKEHRKELISKWKQKQKNTHTDKKVKPKQIKKAKQPVITDNKYLKLEKQLAEANREIAKSKRIISRQKNKIKQLNRENQRLTTSQNEEARKLRNEARKILSDVAEKNKEYLDLQQHLIDLGCDLETPLLEEIVKRNHIINALVKLNQSNYHNRIQSLIKLDSYLKELKNVRTKYQKTSTKLKNLEHKHEQYLNESQRTINNLQLQKQALLKNKSLKSISTQAVISNLINRLNTETFDDFGDLISLYSMYQKVYYQKFEFENQTNILYGFIQVIEESDNKKYIFHDNNGITTTTVHLPKHINPKRITDGIAAKVILEEDSSVSLIKIYPLIKTDHNLDSNRKFNPKILKHLKSPDLKVNLPSSKTITLTNKDVLEWAKTKVITVVGNKNTKSFVEVLSKYVKKVRYYDAYETNPHQVYEAMEASDYVFLLIDSIPHSVVFYTKNSAELNPDKSKVQTFKNPTKYDGVARLNYLYQNNL
ncbi:hypothetical protein [Ligilactobacillus salivarius]|uniref:hypothetical protein n=1 Tax=Ligilactobacillus salivarius TaxID=1624 RepID=UPI002966E01D|nr:hypothetical protein [Ligilactobacillus salivarius]MDW3022628.1 hypothetical protein [Ligilactobacillus salivarius]